MWNRMFTVFAKEVLDNSRDRRSLLVALIYPLLGPALLGLLISAVVNVVSVKTTARMAIPVQGAAFAPGLVAFLGERGINVAPPPQNPEQAVREGVVEFVLVIPEDYQTRFEAQKTADITVIANSSRLPGLIALNRMANLLGVYNSQVWNKRLEDRGLDIQILKPLAISSIDVTSGTHIAQILLFMVPPLFIFNLFMGGVYLAIDTTSGERERGSLEPLLINPVERWALMLGKYFAALVFTAVAVVVQLMAFKLIFQSAGGGNFNFAEILNMTTVIAILVIALPLMMVAVGVQFIMATVTKSYKEAQTYLGLLPLVPAIPGMILVFAPVQAQNWMMMIPTFSQTLLLGQIVRGNVVSIPDALISMTSSIAAAMILIFIAARLYERENLIFGD
ncbi:MAG: ABC transporter permease [Rhodospirillales bacterium]|nr:ABC transporter permease [Rhodospirillales bacterium]